MSSTNNDSIDLIVTSPPYFVDKVYEKKVTYQEYTNMMADFFMQASRILKPSSYLVVNFGDYFNSGNRFYDADVPSCYPASINYYLWGVTMANLDLQATRIWRKQFAKMGIPFVCNTHPRNIFDYEHVWAFRKKGDKKEYVNDRKLSQRGVIGEGWTSSAKINKHPASFPVELPEWAINVYSHVDDIVLDPFMGAGTTGIACKNTNRSFVGIELDENYYNMAVENLKDTTILTT